MFVIKRDGSKQEVHFDKVTIRIKALSHGLDPSCDATFVAHKVIQGICPGISTSSLDELAAETAYFMGSMHPDYSKLAARIYVSNLHKNTQKSFVKTIEALRSATHPKTGSPIPLMSQAFYDFVNENAAVLDPAILHHRDYDYDFFGIKTLEKSYLLRLDGKVAERPQHMLMRVAVAIHLGDGDLKAILQTYDAMSRKLYTHATPTLFNAGMPNQQLSSCFLLTMAADSISGIYETLARCALISKHAGGLGLAIQMIRSKGSYIAGTNGNSNGLVPMLRVFDATMRYVDQGGGKRKGSLAVSIEPWHAEIEDYLELKKNNGKEQDRARDLSYALWIPDLFMRRVEANASWSLFCPNEAPGLDDAYGAEFDALYEKYEATPGLARSTIRAQTLWNQILTAQIETGNPYMMYKDACNIKSNHKNLGTIKCSNLCTEIVQYSSPEETAVCNLASVNLQAFVDDGAFNFCELIRVIRLMTRNLNKVIDTTVYPIESAKRSNMKHRPIGLGVQGLADTFVKMRLPFESLGAKKLNRDIFETIYFAACTESMELAKKHGAYESFPGSPMSQGILQFDMWDQKPNADLGLDWETLRKNIVEFGVRNSLLVAPMPTATTAQILGNNEGAEPFTANIYSRRVLAGDFVVVNHHLVDDLNKLGMWSVKMKDMIVAMRGSVQQIPGIPDDIKELYKTVWEMKQRTILDMSADRGAFIDQSQSMNVHMANATIAKLTAMHFHGWKIGLKTGLYYLRTKPKADAIQFTVTDEIAKALQILPPAPPAVRLSHTQEDEVLVKLELKQVELGRCQSSDALGGSDGDEEECMACGS